MRNHVSTTREETDPMIAPRWTVLLNRSKMPSMSKSVYDLLDALVRHPSLLSAYLQRLTCNVVEVRWVTDLPAPHGALDNEVGHMPDFVHVYADERDYCDEDLEWGVEQAMYALLREPPAPDPYTYDF